MTESRQDMPDGPARAGVFGGADEVPPELPKQVVVGDDAGFGTFQDENSQRGW